MAIKFKLKTFELELPICERKVKYRAWTNGEEKELLIAKEAKSVGAFGVAIGEIVKAVTDNEVDPNVDSHVDVLYAYMMARARSNSSITTVISGCGCSEDAEVRYSIDLSDVKTEKGAAETKQILIGQSSTDEDLFVDMRPLSFNAFISLDKSADPDSKIIRSCIERLYTDEETIDLSTMSDQEWEDFYYSMPKTAFNEIAKFFDNPPRAFIEGKGVCPKCEKEITKRIEGVANFT